MTSAELLEQARKLSRDEQLQLAHGLWVEADGPYEDPVEVEAAWAGEISNRLQGIVEGTTVGIPNSEVRELIRPVTSEPQWDPGGSMICGRVALGTKNAMRVWADR